MVDAARHDGGTFATPITVSPDVDGTAEADGLPDLAGANTGCVTVGRAV